MLPSLISCWVLGAAPFQVGAPMSRLCHHPSTGLLAAACDDLVIRMFDVEVSSST